MSDLRALQSFLARARSRVEPSQFPELRSLVAQRDPRGRRPRGLTQSHMDILLRRPVGTYQRLESGARVRRELLEGAARILELSHDEWRAVWAFAYATEPPSPLTKGTPLGLPKPWQLALNSMSSMAYILDYEGSLLGCNASFRQAFPKGQAPDHLIRWALTSSDAREMLVDWSRLWAPSITAQFRSLLALHPESKILTALRDDLLADEESAALYHSSGQAATTMSQGAQMLPFHHIRWGRGQMGLCSSSPADLPGARLNIALFLQNGPESPTQ